MDDDFKLIESDNRAQAGLNYDSSDFFLLAVPMRRRKMKAEG